jgi:DNA ligase-1
MHFHQLVAAATEVTRTGARLAKIGLLADLLSRLRAGSADEIEIAVSFLSGVPRQGRMGIGWAALQAARTEPPSTASTLDLRSIDAAFERISETSGRGSSAARSRSLRDLFSKATEAEQDFLVRLLAGELRHGALEGLVIEAVARAAQLPSDRVRRAVMLAGDVATVARAVMESGSAGLEQFSLELFRPIQPMLASPSADVEAALARLGRATFEFKVDGARVQVHQRGEEVKIFSRRLNDVTGAAPEVGEVVRGLRAREIVLDGEVVALGSDGRPLPFQVTMRRFGRRLEVEEMRAALPLAVWFFDLLYVDGQDLLALSHEQRMALLRERVLEAHLVPRVITADAQTARTFFAQALEAGHEGLMAKALDAPYQAGTRGQAWLKIKAAHTLDLVVLAAEWGHGRRSGWLSNLHLGARDPGSRSFVMLGKTFKGLTDEMLKWQTQRLLALETHRDTLAVYVRPELVVEIAFNDLQESPHYPGGLALRFARVKAFRPDKSPEQADTISTIRAIHRRSRGYSE